MKHLGLKITFILILALIGLAIASPNVEGKLFGKVPVSGFFPNKDLSLGLDLQGGTQLRYVIDLSKVPTERIQSVVNGVQDVIRKRIDNLGVSEPIIQVANVGVDKHLIIELPGIKDLEEAKKRVGQVLTLQFKEQSLEVDQEEEKRVAEANIERKDLAVGLFEKSKENQNLEELASEDQKARFYRSADFESLDVIPNDLNETLSSLEQGTVSSELIEGAQGWYTVKVVEKKTEEQKEIDASHILIAYQGAERADSEVVRSKDEAKTKAAEVLGKVQAGEDFATLAKEVSDENTETGELPAPVKAGGNYVKEFTDGALKLENKGDISEVVESPFGYHIILARDVRFTENALLKYESIILDKAVVNSQGWKDTELTGEHFEFASPSFDQNSGQIYVSITFTDEGAKLFEDITGRNVQKPIAIFIDDLLISAPNVQQKITGGQAQITGNFSHKDAVQLSQDLNAGSIPAPITLIGQRTVEATLGASALRSGVRAGFIGIMILFLYMIMYYRLSGLLASLALGIYGVLLIALFKLWPVTLTLAGIAGVIFSLGIAVDANILIFERIKEEIKNGRTLVQAVEEGFKRAWSAIIDSNISGLLICGVLFFFGAGIIRGFAVTLSFGILLSLFSAITITRVFLMLLVSKTNIKEGSLVGTKQVR